MRVHTGIQHGLCCWGAVCMALLLVGSPAALAELESTGFQNKSAFDVKLDLEDLDAGEWVCQNEVVQAGGGIYRFDGDPGHSYRAYVRYAVYSGWQLLYKYGTTTTPSGTFIGGQVKWFEDDIKGWWADGVHLKHDGEHWGSDPFSDYVRIRVYNETEATVQMRSVDTGGVELSGWVEVGPSVVYSGTFQYAWHVEVDTDGDSVKDLETAEPAADKDYWLIEGEGGGFQLSGNEPAGTFSETDLQEILERLASVDEGIGNVEALLGDLAGIKGAMDDGGAAPDVPEAETGPDMEWQLEDPPASQAVSKTQGNIENAVDTDQLADTLYRADVHGLADLAPSAPTWDFGTIAVGSHEIAMVIDWGDEDLEKMVKFMRVFFRVFLLGATIFVCARMIVHYA